MQHGESYKYDKRTGTTDGMKTNIHKTQNGLKYTTNSYTHTHSRTLVHMYVHIRTHAHTHTHH